MNFCSYFMNFTDILDERKEKKQIEEIIAIEKAKMIQGTNELAQTHHFRNVKSICVDLVDFQLATQVGPCSQAFEDNPVYDQEPKALCQLANECAGFVENISYHESKLQNS